MRKAVVLSKNATTVAVGFLSKTNKDKILPAVNIIESEYVDEIKGYVTRARNIEIYGEEALVKLRDLLDEAIKASKEENSNG